MLIAASIALLLLFVLRRVYVYIRAQRANSSAIPQLLTSIQPLSTEAALLPHSPFHRSIDFTWYERQTLYNDAPLRTLAMTPILRGGSIIYTSNIALMRQVLGLNSAFYKPQDAMEVLQFMGINVLASEGEVWKRHRRITAPAFNHKTYQNVWATTAQVYADMIDNEGWRDATETPFTNMNATTHKLALFIISIVGFGIPMSWVNPHRDERGKLSLQAMMTIVAASIMERSAIPTWMYKLGIKKLNDIDEAYNALEEFMLERIVDRETELKKIRAMEGVNEEDIADGIRDVFGRLVNARLDGAKIKLSDKEIIGNCFIFAFAGHETTASTLTATLALLALYPEAQDWVYKSIESTLKGREPTFEDFDSLQDVLACFYEALRLFPAAFLMFRSATSDTVVDLPRSDCPSTTEKVSISKDTNIVLDLVGMNYDPQVYPDPEAFQPWRWTKSTSSTSISITEAVQADEVTASSPSSSLDGFHGFSFGPRTCLGHKFAKIEAVAFLTLLLRDWTVVVELNKGESKEEWRERVLRPRFAIALLFGGVPIKLVRR